ncbi:unnamed protein product, partial [Heterotrigona itama]
NFSDNPEIVSIATVTICFPLFQRSLDKQPRGSARSSNALRVRRSDQALMTTRGNGRECPGHVAVRLLGLFPLTSTFRPRPFRPPSALSSKECPTPSHLCPTHRTLSQKAVTETTVDHGSQLEAIFPGKTFVPRELCFVNSRPFRDYVHLHITWPVVGCVRVDVCQKYEEPSKLAVLFEIVDTATLDSEKRKKKKKTRSSRRFITRGNIGDGQANPYLIA